MRDNALIAFLAFLLFMGWVADTAIKAIQSTGTHTGCEKPLQKEKKTWA